mgnify:CR=1 FL=1
MTARLIVMDIDSTLINQEVIDLLGEEAGVGEQVAQITERAMRGELDFKQALEERVGLLAGLDESVFERTFERGVEDFTYACGTGTGSVAAALTLQGKVSGHQVKVNMTGGQLIVDVDRVGSTIQNLYLTGPTNIVCKGEVTDEELKL